MTFLPLVVKITRFKTKS